MNKKVILSLALVPSLSFGASPFNYDKDDLQKHFQQIREENHRGIMELRMREERRIEQRQQYWDRSVKITAGATAIVLGSAALVVAAPAIGSAIAGGTASAAVSPFAAEYGLKSAGALMGSVAHQTGLADKIQEMAQGNKNPIVIPASNKSDNNKSAAPSPSSAPVDPAAPSSSSWGGTFMGIASWARSTATVFVGGVISGVASEKAMNKLSGREQKEKEDRKQHEKEHREQIEAQEFLARETEGVGKLTVHQIRSNYQVAHGLNRVADSNERLLDQQQKAAPQNLQDLLSLPHEHKE